MTPHPLVVPCSRKSSVIPLFSLWAVRPVQSVNACTRVHFTSLIKQTLNILRHSSFIILRSENLIKIIVFWALMAYCLRDIKVSK
jgi:hypothetical protein